MDIFAQVNFFLIMTLKNFSSFLTQGNTSKHVRLKIECGVIVRFDPQDRKEGSDILLLLKSLIAYHWS